MSKVIRKAERRARRRQAEIKNHFHVESTSVCECCGARIFHSVKTHLQLSHKCKECMQRKIARACPYLNIANEILREVKE